LGKNRLEAFSDGVIAIIITIMVLELKVPHGADLRALLPLWPIFLSYVLSFIYIAIYWNNHHHMLHVVHTVGGGVLWARAVYRRHRPFLCSSMAGFRDLHRGRGHVACPGYAHRKNRDVLTRSLK
jgi:hypothetical protein